MKRRIGLSARWPRLSRLAASTVQAIWKSHGLAPHRWRQFKLARDPASVEKLHDVVGPYVVPPAHAVVLSVDKKSQLHALDRTQPALPMTTGRGATMTHDIQATVTDLRSRGVRIDAEPQNEGWGD